MVILHQRHTVINKNESINYYNSITITMCIVCKCKGDYTKLQGLHIKYVKL